MNMTKMSAKYSLLGGVALACTALSAKFIF